jgi:hypothetical protein
MDSQNEWRADVEDEETNLGMMTVFAEDDGGGRKSSSNFSLEKVRRKRDLKLRRSIYEATSGGSEKGSYFWHRGLHRHIYI